LSERKQAFVKILVIGSGGMLGHITTLYLREIGYDVVDISRKNKINEKTILLDVVAAGTLSFNFLSDFDVIINCAALLTGLCEKNKHDAILLNSWFPHSLENELKNTKTKIIQVSTDGIFCGFNPPYQEDSLAHPPTFYGRTKLLGELDNSKDLTVRASFVGPDMHKDGTGLFHWFFNQRGVINGYSNVMFNAVTGLEFAKFVDLSIKDNISGICHLGASETVSKAQFLREVQNIFKITCVTINDDDIIKSDNTLVSIRKDVNYKQKSYCEMLGELKSWMCGHKKLYSHYAFI
jgi:dTDP-4-dehydrorhamnose reductase